jgi:hypothetical protein
LISLTVVMANSNAENCTEVHFLCQCLADAAILPGPKVAPPGRALPGTLQRSVGFGRAGQPFRELLHDSIAADGSVRISEITLHSGRSASTTASQILVNISAMPNP